MSALSPSERLCAAVFDYRESCRNLQLAQDEVAEKAKVLLVALSGGSIFSSFDAEAFVAHLKKHT